MRDQHHHGEPSDMINLNNFTRKDLKGTQAELDAALAYRERGREVFRAHALLLSCRFEDASPVFLEEK